MEFEGKKARVLAAMAAARPDKSPKGSLDAPIVPLLDTINSNTAYLTTSSCSGRISILAHLPTVPTQGEENEEESDPTTTTTTKKKKSKKKAGGGGWVFVSHDPADPDAVAALVFGSHTGFEGGELVLRFEPLIVAVECRDVAAAQALVSTAISCGFRESGITSMHKRIMVAIRCSIRLEVPLGQVGRIVVSPEYVRYLIGIANEKMEANRRRTDCFLHALKYKGQLGSAKENFGYTQNNQEWMVLKQTLMVLEAKQVSLLSKIKLLENVALKYHNQQSSLDNVGDNCGSHSAEVARQDSDGSCENSVYISNQSCEADIGNFKEEKTDTDSNSGLSGLSKCSFPVMMLTIVGEPVEKLFLWGHSSCIISINWPKQIIIFGGFGGLGRHARRNYSLTLDPISGLLQELSTMGPPSPRLGHTSSVVGNCVYVIGGRGGPTQLFDDVWVLDTVKKSWMLLECIGSVFHPRHRHAAVAVGSNIYIFGGLNNEVIYSSMNVLNTETLEWSEVSIQGEWPCARHSHSLVVYGSQLFMFGGYDGQKALGDFYSFDVRTCLWKKEKTTGRTPYPRFSHSMFLYKNFLGIVGGCPAKQGLQELALLNLHKYVWMHVTVESVGRDLWIRSSTSVVDDKLFIVGGGASCYAFGTKFNQPMKIDLQLIESMDYILPEKEDKFNLVFDGSNLKLGVLHSDGHGHHNNTNLVLQIDKKYAKLTKDILKKRGWLDLGRRVQTSQDGCRVLFPVERKFYSIFQEKHLTSVRSFDSLEGSYEQECLKRKGLSVDEVSPHSILNFLSACGGSLLIDNAACSRKISKAPQKILRELVCSFLKEKGMLPHLLEQVPRRWERLGDIVVLPVTSFKDPKWDLVGVEFWPIVARSLGTKRLARQGRVLPTGTRDSTLEMLVGDDGWVTHHENGIYYSFDVTKCMFSFGNLSEKLRMAHLDCRDEIIVDLFAGIGYFVLPFLVKAKAKLVYACEWNPHALKALRHNVHANFVADRCIILEGDNRVIAPRGVADRICLGLLPSSECSWVTAVRALRVEGGVLHIHGNVNDSEEDSWLERVVKSIECIAQSEGLSWDVSIQHVEQVKWYGPHIRHLVADVRCKLFCT